jgi:hypothetical protein
MGANDGKVADSAMVSRLAVSARWGRSCGMAFDAEAFFDRHPQYDWLRGHMKSRQSYPWCELNA